MAEPVGNPQFRYIARKRRTKEDRRFVAGAGRFAADIDLPGMLHVALVASPHVFARIRSIDAKSALALPGVFAVLTGDELARGIEPVMSGLDLPKAQTLSAGIGARALCRRMGRGGGGRKPRRRRGRGRAGRGRVRIAPGGGRSRGGSQARGAGGASRSRLERAVPAQIRLGSGRARFRRSRAQACLPRALAPQLDRADRNLRRGGELEPCRAIAGNLGLDPDAEISRSARPRATASRQRGPRPFRCRCRRQLWRQARPEAQHSDGIPRQDAGASGAPDRGPAREHARRRRPRAPTASSTCRWHSTAAALSARSKSAHWTMSAPMPAAHRCNWASRSAPSSALIASAASNTRRSASPPTRRRRRRCAASARHRPISRSRPRSTAWRGIWAWTASNCAAATSSAARNSPTPSRAAAPMTAAITMPCSTRR